MEQLKVFREWRKASYFRIQEALELLRTASLVEFKAAVGAISKDWKDQYSTLLDIGRKTKNVTTPDLVFPIETLDLNIEDWSQIIIEYIFRIGNSEVLMKFLQESGIEVGDADLEGFCKFSKIILDICEKDFRLVAEFAEKNEKSKLLFFIRRFVYLDLIQNSNSKEALSYARKYLRPHLGEYEGEIRMLLGILSYSGRVFSSPYSKIFHRLPIDLEELKEMFATEYFSGRSCLEAGIDAGILSYSGLRNLYSLLLRSPDILCETEEFPLDVQLPPWLKFHTLFSCPILKEYSTSTNPPILLSCGHIVSQNALNSLAESSNPKCPYCPVPINKEKARLAHF